MADPKEILLSEHNSGIKISFIKRRQVLSVFGWYDSFVGIEGGEISLRDFFDQLGIDLKMCQKAFK